MEVNIKRKLENNIISKYVSLEDPKYLAKYDRKQRSMWRFAYLMARCNIDKAVYNSNKDEKMLNHQLNIFLTMGEEKFTLEEWFEFMGSQKD